MYLEFYHFREEPFCVTPNPRFLYMGAQYEAALASLTYGIEQRKGFLTLIGEVGTGKSTLCRALVERLTPNVDVAMLLSPAVSEYGILRTINHDFGNPVSADSLEGQMEALHAFLLQQLKRGRNAVVIADEAQNISFCALEVLRLLSNLETDSSKLLQILLVGQPELADMLSATQLRQLTQRIAVRSYLHPLSQEAVRAYVYHRMTTASLHRYGSRFLSRMPVFHSKALGCIYGYTRGYPRLINLLCDRALLLAYARRTTLVDKGMITLAWKDITGNAHLPSVQKRGLPCL